MEKSKQQTFRIGTRGSLLAVTQSEITKNLLESETGLQFEIKTIKTQGDIITDKPLWQLEGKDFFTKELDANLLEKNIDLVIHSYKDLGSERPEGIKLGCITKRFYPHDILLIKKSTVNKIPNLDTFIVGTSSPRRITNLEAGLHEFLPHFHGKVEAKNLRGNVNTRIEKLLNDDYHAITLAFAGLERLAHREDSKKVLEELVKDLTFMILPVKEFPPAASQGALALETHEENTFLQQELAKISDQTTIEEIQREREAFQSYGGGCHLAVGVFVRKLQNYFIHFHKGQVDGKQINVKKLEGVDYSPLKGKSVYYLFRDFDFLVEKKATDYKTDDSNIFVTSSHCIGSVEDYNTLWAAGNRTMKKLASKGLWVCGSSEGFGHQEIVEFQKSKLLQIFLKDSKWEVLSHDQAQSEVGPCKPAYTREIREVNDQRVELMLDAEVIYWSSDFQYKTYTQKYPELKNKIHTCGLGKTFKKLTKMGVEVTPVIDMTHLKELTKDDHEL